MIANCRFSVEIRALVRFPRTENSVIIIEDIIEERQKRFPEKYTIASYTNTK